MKRQIRYGMFETNSSSMHSVVVTKSEPARIGSASVELEPDGTWRLLPSELEFDCDMQILDTFEDRVRYAIASLCGDVDPASAKLHLEEITSVVKEVLPNFTHFKIEPYVWDDECGLYGYVDDQSIGLVTEYLEHDTLEDFLLSNRTHIVISNDNMYPEQQDWKWHYIDRDDVKYEIDKYGIEWR